MYIVIAIVAFGVLVAVHELGHFLAAKSLGIKVNEFAIGMGPKIISKQKGETTYSLRALPIGGFCAMEGEDGEAEDPRAFVNKSIPKRLVVLIAGSFMNFLVGFLIVLILFSGRGYYSQPVLTGFMDGFPLEGENGLMAGDRILSVDGHHVSLVEEVTLYLSRGDGESADIVVRRDGKRVKLDDLPLQLREYETENGTEMKYGLYFKVVEGSFGEVIRQTWANSIYFVKMVRMGLSDLITGAAKLRDLSGPVGIVSMINEVGQSSPTTSAALWSVAYLAVMNMLPIPALDGGRVFVMLVSWCIEKIIGRKLNPKVEAYIHGAGLVLLLALMAYVMFNDIVKLF
jgi:regulator of sigma E protease